MQLNTLNKLNQELEKKLLDQENQIKKDQNDLNNLHKNISFLELRQVDKKKELQGLSKEGFNQEENIKLIQKLEEEFISNNNLIKDYQNCIKSKKIADVTFLQLLEEIRKNLPEDNKDIVNFNLNILRSTQKSEEKLITKIHTLTKKFHKEISELTPLTEDKKQYESIVKSNEKWSSEQNQYLYDIYQKILSIQEGEKLQNIVTETVKEKNDQVLSDKVKPLTYNPYHEDNFKLEPVSNALYKHYQTILKPEELKKLDNIQNIKSNIKKNYPEVKDSQSFEMIKDIEGFILYIRAEVYWYLQCIEKNKYIQLNQKSNAEKNVNVAKELNKDKLNVIKFSVTSGSNENSDIDEQEDLNANIQSKHSKKVDLSNLKTELDGEILNIKKSNILLEGEKNFYIQNIDALNKKTKN